MPTKPLEKILNREFSKAYLKEEIQKSSELLKEIINYSTRVYSRCVVSSNRSDEDSVVFNLFHHMIEMTDGIEVLLSQSCIKSSTPSLRILFETLLYIEYILKDGEFFERRARSWLYFFYLDMKKYNSDIDLSSEEGIIFKEALQNDKLLKKSEPEHQEIVKDAINKINKYISTPNMQDIEVEYNRLKKKAGRLRWYQLFSDNCPEDKNDLGLGNLYKLSECLNRKAEYLFFYSKWSSIIHCYSLDSYHAKNGNILTKRIRHPEKSKLIESNDLSARFLLDAIKVISEKYRPGDNMGVWYSEEIAEKFPLNL